MLPVSAKYQILNSFYFSAEINYFAITLSSEPSQGFNGNGLRNAKDLESAKTLNIFPFVGSGFFFTKNFLSMQGMILEFQT